VSLSRRHRVVDRGSEHVHGVGREVFQQAEFPGPWSRTVPPFNLHGHGSGISISRPPKRKYFVVSRKIFRARASTLANAGRSARRGLNGLVM